MRHFLFLAIGLACSNALAQQKTADLGDPKDPYNTTYYCRDFQKAQLAFRWEITHNKKTPSKKRIMDSFGKLTPAKARFATICALSNKIENDEEWNSWLKENILSSLYEIQKRRYSTQTASDETTTGATAPESN